MCIIGEESHIMASHIYDAIIVGAGLAGLSAACTLVEDNVTNILVIEAQSYVGGRVRTETIDEGFVFDHGAQWIHGEKNPIHDLARDCQLLSQVPSAEGEGLYLTENRKVVDFSLIDRVAKEVDEALDDLDPSELKNIEEMFRNLERKIPNQDPLIKGLFQWHRNYQLIDNACSSLEQLPIDAWNEYEDCPGNYCQLVKNGFSSLIDELKRKLPPDVVRCNQAAHRIVWQALDQEPFTNQVESTPISAQVFIELKNGDILKCHHVIVTCSAGYLKRNVDALFRPQLPPEWLTAFHGIGFGTITKILLLFDAPFWDDNCKGFQFVWTDQAEEEPAPWYRYLTGFDVQKSSSSAVLLGWVGGDGATFLDLDPMSDETLGDQCVQLLSQFSGFANIPKPSKTLRSRWAGNDYVQGAYSYRLAPFNPKLLDPLGSTTDGRKVPNLLFAGEAFHLKHYSTTHGAFESGRDQAKKLSQWMNNQVLKY